MEIRITTLSENTAISDYMAEWGLSMLVEAYGKRVLFDTGRTFSAVYNAQLMGIDLSKIDCIVLSHSHGDHTGGLRGVLERSGRKEIIAHPTVLDKKYGRRDGEAERYIGIPFGADMLENLGASFHLSRKPVKLSPHMMTTGEVPMVTDYEEIDAGLCIKKDGVLQKDDCADDLSMILDTEFGLVVILGCAHRGMINTLYHARELTGKENVYAVIGGTHLLNASEERLEKTAAALSEMGVQMVAPCHCTGFHSALYLAQVFGDRFYSNNAGTRITLPL